MNITPETLMYIKKNKVRDFVWLNILLKRKVCSNFAAQLNG